MTEEEKEGRDGGWAAGEERRVEWTLGEGGKSVAWRVNLLPGPRLLLHLEPAALPDGSKEWYGLLHRRDGRVGEGRRVDCSFVQLLEWAEEELGCVEVVLEVGKERPDLALHLRTFSYFGFALLPPDKAQHFVDTSRSLAMAYTI